MSDIPNHLPTQQQHDPVYAETPGFKQHGNLPRRLSLSLCLVLLTIGYASVYVQGGDAIAAFIRSSATNITPSESAATTPGQTPRQASTPGTSGTDTSPGDTDHATITLENDTTPNALGHTKDPELTLVLDEFVAQHGDVLRIYAADLPSDTYAEYQSREPVPSGSIYKLFVAGEVFRRAERGSLDMQAPSGVNNWTIAQCTQQMVQNSSNACGKAMRRRLGPEKINTALRRQGYKNTDIAQNPAAETSARDVAHLLQRVYEGGYFAPEHTREFRYYLKHQKYTFRIPEGLPRKPAIQGKLGTRNKTGDVFGYTNDAAIVLGENTDYVLVILSGEWPSPVASSSVHRYISGTLYNYFNETGYELPYGASE